MILNVSMIRKPRKLKMQLTLKRLTASVLMLGALGRTGIDWHSALKGRGDMVQQLKSTRPEEAEEGAGGGGGGAR